MQVFRFFWGHLAVAFRLFASIDTIDSHALSQPRGMVSGNNVLISAVRDVQCSGSWRRGSRRRPRPLKDAASADYSHEKRRGNC